LMMRGPVYVKNPGGPKERHVRRLLEERNVQEAQVPGEPGLGEKKNGPEISKGERHPFRRGTGVANGGPVRKGTEGVISGAELYNKEWLEEKYSPKFGGDHQRLEAKSKR